MAWILYFLGFALMMNGVDAGLFVILFGMLLHWKFWVSTIIVGTVAFFVGAGMNKPSL